MHGGRDPVRAAHNALMHGGRDPVSAAAFLAAAVLTVLAAASFVLLALDSPPWDREWRDGHFAIGMLIGAAATVDGVVLLLRRRLAAPVLAWVSVLAVAGLILMLACWLALVVRAVG